jgi:hypothetical protein
MRALLGTAVFVLVVAGSMGCLCAGTITLSGTITQSTQDGTGPAVNNPALNGIADGDTYTLKLDFTGSIAGIGSYDPLPGASLTFKDGAIQETAFDSADVTIYADADPSLYDVSLLGCLSSGSGCYSGNSLAANFSIAASEITSSGAAADIPALSPSLDLEEDDGVTDIQGTVNSFSNPSSGTSSPVPEPATAGLLFVSLTAFCAARRCAGSRCNVSKSSAINACGHSPSGRQCGKRRVDGS